MGVKTENFRVTGTSHYVENLKKLLEPNDDYNLPKRELADSYEEWEKIYEYEIVSGTVQLVPEPTNEYDANAIKVLIDDELVGYIKKGSCSHVKNLIASPNYLGVYLNYANYGKFKTVYRDDEGKVHFETDSKDTPSIGITIKTRTSDSETDEIQKNLQNAEPDEEGIEPQPLSTIESEKANIPDKKKSYPKGMYIFVLVFDIIGLLLSLLILAVDHVSGIVLILVFVLIFFINRHYHKKYGKHTP